jgi:hypothetical protein
VTGRWFSLGTPVSSTNKSDRHDITEILLRTTRFVSGTFSPGTQSQKIGKPNNVEIFGSKNTKGSKQNNPDKTYIEIGN